MKKQRYEVTIRRIVDVEVDETKFDAQFYKEFCETFWKMRELGEHMEYLARVSALEERDLKEKYFLEGYGPCEDMGIKTHVVDEDVETEAVKE